MNRTLSLILVGAALAAPSASQAHFLWASIDSSKGTLAVGLQEVPTDEPLPLGERAPKVKAWSRSAKPLPLKAEGNWLKSPLAEDCAGVSLDYGVLDKRDQGRGVFWLNYYAKAAATAAASQTKVNLPVELSLANGPDGKPVVTVFKDGKPVPSADVVVELPDGKVAFEGKTAADGTVTLPASSGPISVRGLVTDTTKGSHDGKAYDLVRSYCTLTVGSIAPVESKPLTRLLQESFGNNHEVVSHTAFIETLMGGKLTKAQLEAHLQQRALVHQEVDRILRAAGASQPVPYGDEQKRVIDFLRSDITAMGSKWPAADQAWPLTKEFLQEIRASEKNGPYFALGVLHVYYGGITHGGRDIGAIIADSLKVEQTYYLKSDGYADYVKGVNAIKEPEAQKEMIRGGQAAYKYIIASNGAEVFKSK